LAVGRPFASLPGTRIPSLFYDDDAFYYYYYLNVTRARARFYVGKFRARDGENATDREREKKKYARF